MYFNELTHPPAIRFKEKPQLGSMNFSEGFFPFHYDEGSGLYIGYITYRKEGHWVKYDIEKILTPEFVKDTKELALHSSPSSLGFFSDISFRVFEVYFEKPQVTILYGDDDFLVSSVNPQTGVVYNLDDHQRRFITTDGLLIPLINSGYLIIQDPSKYIKGVLWKDYDNKQLEPYRHLL